MSWLFPTGNQINLQLGWPSPSLFPVDALKQGADAVLSDSDAATAALIYGPNPGAPALRKELARWLGTAYHHDPAAIDVARISVTAGASQTLANILLRFADPSYTRHVWMVEPTYFLACPVFEDCGFAGKLRGVPEDDEGIDLVFLRAALEAAEQAVSGAQGSQNGAEDRPKAKPASYEKIYKHIIYCVPTFANPSGKTMSLGHRRALVRLAMEFDALIVSDDVYDLLYWPASRERERERDGDLVLPPRLVDINRQLDPNSKWGNTVSNGSFSKIVAPGTRTSWIEATPAFATWLANTGATWSGGNPAHLVSSMVERLLSSGRLEAHIRDVLIPTYCARYFCMIDAIDAHLAPLGVRIDKGTPYMTSAWGDASKTEDIELAGGFFLCITLPTTEGYPRTSELATAAIARKELKFAHGKMFEVKGDAGSKARSDAGYGSTVRLCWAFHDEATIEEGIRRLRDVLVESRVSA
ncbi:Valine--pyruvate aminotransferase [Sporothrix curviconia]|uniref:Valine--pyruvate aminotransferase n=1 Tax=Sporothrix curviconia TaxID=1260050 RepID=A0ABP0BUN9_9PEZI